MKPEWGSELVVEGSEGARALADLVASLADNKYFLGRRYAEWCTAAPALEAAVAAAAMAQDEIGHARSLYPLLRDLIGTGPEAEPETRTSFTNAAFLERPFGSWIDFVAANFLFDTALTTLLLAAHESSFGGLAQRARRMVPEERVHWLHGEGWTRRLARSGEAVRTELRRSFRPVNQEAEAWFEIVSPDLVEGGVVAGSAESLRSNYRARIGEVISRVGLEIG